ncbi:hypothetical protein [Arthrobacter rhombi]|uniref:hypothetical protein n=1 Tax=Arthrobacter rhombi TaxID=71253 RepID=UPI003FCFB505
MTSLGTFPRIDVPWDDLEDSAMDMDTRAGTTSSYLKDAQTAWKRLPGAYEHDETQSTVYAALDDLTTPLDDWSNALCQTKTAICDFVDTGRKLQKESESLDAALPGLKSKVEADPDGEDSGTTTEVTDFNERARQLRSDWETAQSTAAEALGGITAGTGSTLPMSEPLGGSSLPKVSWADFTSGLDEDFGKVRPEDLLASLRGLSSDELRVWANVNPEAAEALANNELRAGTTPGSAEATMLTAMEDNDELTREGIAGIRDAWSGLSDKSREKLLLLYPGKFGNLNGVPMAARATANIITVAGFREQVRRKQATADPEPNINDFTADAFSKPGHDRVRAYEAQGLFEAAHQEWEERKHNLQSQAEGLEYAWEHETQVVMVSLDGDGRVVSMKGTPSEDTDTVSTLVPGTGADLGELQSYTERLDAVDGAPSPRKVSFYWQGADLPNEVSDNLTSKYNEEGSSKLAAFDFAVDAEIPDDARSTYVGYSAGGSLLGTAEREGLNSDNIVYVAPAGTGNNVGSIEDTGPSEDDNNSEANRYWVQTRDDPIHWAQDFGGGYHGRAWWSGSYPDQQMGAHRLESGFLDSSDPKSIVKGHVEYFKPGSTSAQNIQEVIEGGNVSLFVEDRQHPGPRAGTFSPFERNPEDYAYGKLETVPTESLEQ